MALGNEVQEGLDNAGTLGEWARLFGWSGAKSFMREPESWGRERGHCITSSSMYRRVGGKRWRRRSSWGLATWIVPSAQHWRLS